MQREECVCACVGGGVQREEKCVCGWWCAEGREVRVWVVTVGESVCA